MNFKKLSKQKRTHFILVVLLTLGVLGLLGFGLIKHQYNSLSQLAGSKKLAEQKLHKMQNAIVNANHLEADLVQARQNLTVMERDIASGDLYSWVINTLRGFKLPYKVEIPQYSPIGPTTEMTMLPSFPYRQAAITIGGTAHFHDFGHFLADFENQFPHIRVQNLKLDGGAAPVGTEEPELLNFSMEIVTLVKPNAS